MDGNRGQGLLQWERIREHGERVPEGASQARGGYGVDNQCNSALVKSIKARVHLTRLQAQAAGVSYSHPLSNLTGRMACYGPNMMFAGFKMFAGLYTCWAS